MDKVLEGVVIGVSSGLILAFAFWLMDFLKSCRERKVQIRHLSDEISRFRDLIYQSTELRIERGGTTLDYSKDDVRKAYYDDMRRQVTSILHERASRLSYEEKKAVNDVFITDLFPTVVLNENGYDKIFGELQSLKWLRLRA